MGKYLNAEFYKLLHRRSYSLGLLGFLLGGEALLLFLLKTAGFSNATTYNQVLGILPMTLAFGLYLVPGTADMVFSDQYKQNTLKNELSYGLPRGRVYLGKLLAEVFASVILCAVVLLFYVAVGALVFPERDGAMTANQLFNLGKSLLAALPLWLGGLGLIHMLLFVTKGSVSAVVLYVVLLSAGDILDIAGLFLPKLAQVLYTVKNWLIGTPMDSIVRGAADIPYAWTIGMLWLVFSTLIGLISFQKREIN